MPVEVDDAGAAGIGVVRQVQAVFACLGVASIC
jgi:hypothetical protein